VSAAATVKAVELGRTVKAVAWSFLGIRRKDGFEQDTAQIKPLPLIVTGFVAAVLFVIGLMLFVRWVVAA
jgi:hypothetical protein